MHKDSQLTAEDVEEQAGTERNRSWQHRRYPSLRERIPV